jgi:uncharacterized membrane protein
LLARELFQMRGERFVTDYLLDWCGLLVRWLHLIAGIAWIGSSFYFVWLDNSLEPLGERESPDPRVAGELWAVHGGGFYRARKYRVAPQVLPPRLHWFYWEAYTTWLSGFGLLCLLYFLRAEAYLIDPAVMPLSQSAAIGIALAMIIAGWLVYDGLCRSTLGRRPRALAACVAIVTALEAWGLCHVFSGRGAFMVFGAALGSIMVANVLFIIIPGQRELVLAKQQGREPDPGPGLRGKQRSIHNTYFTLPVLFVMISNHYALTYGARYNWAVLIAMSFAGACIRGWFVARHKLEGRHGLAAALPAVLGAATLVGLVVALAPRRMQSTAPGLADVSTDVQHPGTVAHASGPFDRTEPSHTAADTQNALPTVDPGQVQAIFEKRCVPCHSNSPKLLGLTAPPNGIILETLDELRAHLPEIRQQVSLRAMPLGNLTGMTEEERAQVLMWIGHGALTRTP